MPLVSRPVANLTSFLILCGFFWGRSLAKKNLSKHIRVMSAVMAADLTLIAVLVFKQRALEKVNNDMPVILMIHIPIAVATVVLYALTAWTGYLLLRGQPVRKRLVLLDKILVTARVLTLTTSLML